MVHHLENCMMQPIEFRALDKKEKKIYRVSAIDFVGQFVTYEPTLSDTTLTDTAQHITNYFKQQRTT